ncbi:trypsin-like peptidase domain-containing protein [Chloroflexi bacterium]|nr:trypsin-like peptidase domain-containing protein [Chloroflexota bacterium]
MNKATSLLLIMLLIVAACGTKSSTDHLKMTANSNPSPDALEESFQKGKAEDKSLTLPSAASALITTEIEDTAPVPVIIPAETPSVPVADLISVSEVENTMTTVEAVRELGPSVVQISTDTVAISLYNRIVPQTGVGSGIIIDKVGNVLTNNHVVEGADLVTVTLNDGRSYPATLVGSDNITDLAVIKISAAKLTPAKFGRSAELQVGEDVIAVGHALGLKGGPTVSKGVVSALERTIQTDAQKAMVDLIQTDASINPGNSGGPLANSKGEVIGINTAIIDDSNGIGFAINIDDAHVVVDQILTSGNVLRGFLGITPFNVTDSIREQINLPVADGVIIAGVVSGFPAEKSGLQPEDVIVMLNKVSIENAGDLSKFLLNNPPGSKVEVRFYRNGELRKVDIVLADKPS